MYSKDLGLWFIKQVIKKVSIIYELLNVKFTRKYI
jgi:hypothetical protein